MAQTIVSCTRLGISPKWPSHKSVLRRIAAACNVGHEQDLSVVRAYVNRERAPHMRALPMKNNVTESKPEWIGSIKSHQVLATAPENAEWAHDLAHWLRFYQVGVKQNVFWHYQYRILFPEHSSGGLRMFNFATASNLMAAMAMLGWRDSVRYQGYLAHAALKRGYQLQIQYEQEHRRAQAFMLKLFADWVGDVTHSWPAYAYDEPIYEALLAQWRVPDADELVPCLMAACDRHTWQSGKESMTKFYDFDQDWHLERVPVEILLLYRLREWEGLPNPRLDHPLMAKPFNCLLPAQPIPPLDDLMEGVLKRAHEDWPDYNDVLSLSMLRV